MADLDGNIDLSKITEFKPTMELRWIDVGSYNPVFAERTYKEVLQQKWTNELNEEQWRDVPSVIKE